METILQKISDFADHAHGEQIRKYTPERYIAHPIRVMESCRRYTKDICILSAALLHDVLEDTAIKKEELYKFLLTLLNQAFADRTLTLVTELTDVYVKSNYPKLNRRQRKTRELARLEKTSPDSQTIKYADIIDNTVEIVDQDPDFAKVFLFECRSILRKLDKGNKELYYEATKIVDEAIMLLTGSGF